MAGTNSLGTLEFLHLLPTIFSQSQPESLLGYCCPPEDTYASTDLCGVELRSLLGSFKGKLLISKQPKLFCFEYSVKTAGELEYLCTTTSILYT